jgi:hypothetical protein
VPLVIRFKDRKEWNEDRSAPGESIETLEKIKQKRAEEMERNQKRVLVKRKIKKAK